MPRITHWGHDMALDASVDLRALVREVLRESLASRAAVGPAGGVHTVNIASDADLQALIARLAAPGGIEAVRAGSVKYMLAATHETLPAQPIHTVKTRLEGVISERKIRDIESGSTIALAASAVVTPMAKDLARRMGLKFERME